MCSRAPYLGGFASEQCQKVMVSGIKQIASVSFEMWGLKKGGASIYFTRPGTSILILFDCEGTPVYVGAIEISFYSILRPQEASALIHTPATATVHNGPAVN